MAKHGKKYRTASDTLERKAYAIDEALGEVKKVAYAGFDESVDAAIRLAVDPKHADQMVRGTVVLPHGTGKEVRVLVFASGEKIKEAEAAGADHVGGAELAEKIQDGWLDFDTVVSTPDMMKEVGKLGRVLGPRGMMPNPKAGTVTFDVGKAVEDIKAGKVEFRVDKAGILHVPFGRISFEETALRENLVALMQTVLRLRPAAAKGKYVRSVSISPTMGPSVAVDEGDLVAVAEA